MDKSEDNRRYKWSSSATNLLISIWSHELVQNQLELSTRNQPIWDSIAKYMGRKGYSVTGLQCRTRIKNMLCTYNEGIKKNDLSGIEPYYHIFKKILGKKKIKKKEIKTSSESHIDLKDKTEDNKITLFSNNYESESTLTSNNANEEYDIEFLEISNNDSSSSSSNFESIKELSDTILKAVDLQTKAITQAINNQTQMIERLIAIEKEKFELILESERESRKELEVKLDKLLSVNNVNTIPQVTYMSTLIDTRQKE